MTRRKCCCAGGPCAGMCSLPWKSSYSLTGLAGTVAYSKTTSADAFCLCVGQQAQAFVRNWSVSVTWTQPVPIVLVRTQVSPGVCCYYGQGEVLLNATVTVEDALLCCQNSELNTSAQTFTRNGIAVPICVSLVCGDLTECTALAAGQKMNLNVCICDFPLAESVTLNTYDDQADNCTYELLPDQEIGLVMGGICYYHEAIFKDPMTLLARERSIASLCSSQAPSCAAYPGTTTGIDPVSCMPCVRDYVVTNGPFAVKAVQPFAFGIDDPDPCSCVAGAAVAGLRNVPYACPFPATMCDPCLNFTASNNCCELIFARNLPWPVFT